MAACAHRSWGQGPGAAGTWALLVGVGAVASLPPRLRLQGPRNDVHLMRQTLLARGVLPERIQLLTDGMPEAAADTRPTHRGVTQAMDKLLQRVRPGEHVVLHLAGHGAQVPQRAGARWPEPDGLDEVFLLADVQPWRTDEGRLPNALLDDDIGDWMDALVDRGATVLAVFDCCHAAGMARDDGRPTRIRAVPAAELGVPPGPGPAPSASDASGPPPRLDGRVLAYAARAAEATAEEWLPRGAGLRSAHMHGVFSWAVAQALGEGAATPQALLESVRRQYGADQRKAPVPQVLGVGTRVVA